ncbi:hypothetical protein JRI60_51225 [Archangium violaceum]|uniref:hypothetical protein n=1 Tax=Archangium violaceum TaxID=83451 RepID=UPI001951A56F|nr:hypothetical protein [Archangium violaceum]QRN97230.1 hypothetical protein JRI60_51225 [Archangium violaceum]
MIRRIVVSCTGALALWLSGCANCEQLQEAAQTLVSDYARCRPGDSCQTVDLLALAGGQSCLGAFQCFGALNSKANLTAFQQRAQLLSQRAAVVCLPGECVTAACLDPRELEPVCDTELGQCVLVPREP